LCFTLFRLRFFVISISPDEQPSPSLALNMNLMLISGEVLLASSPLLYHIDFQSHNNPLALHGSFSSGFAVAAQCDCIFCNCSARVPGRVQSSVPLSLASSLIQGPTCHIRTK
jgi:hypothetical protein